MNIKLLKGIVINLVITVAITLLTFLVNKYFANFMGAEVLGLMKLFTQLLAYLSLAEMGLGAASAYALYKPLADKNYEKINVVVSTIGSLYNKIALGILLAGILINPIIPIFIKEYKIDYTVYIYWTLYVISTAMSYTFAKYNILFTANQEFNYVRLVQGVGRIIAQSLQIFVIVKYQSFMWFIILLTVDNLIQYSLYLWHFKKNYSYVKKVKEREKGILRDLMNLFWHKISGLIVNNTDYIVISSFIGLKMVGIYSSYIMIMLVSGTIISILTNVINPHIGRFIAKNEAKEVYDLWKKINILFMAIGIILTYGTYKVINPFIELWIGKDFLLPHFTVILIMVNLFITSTRNITDIFKANSGFFDDIHLPIIEGVSNLVFSLILVQYIGVNGVIIGTIISNVTIIYLAKPILVFKRCFDRSAKDYIFILMEYMILTALAVGISEFVLSKVSIWKNMSSWSSFTISSAVIGAVISLATLIVFLLNKDFRRVLKIKK